MLVMMMFMFRQTTVNTNAYSELIDEFRNLNVKEFSLEIGTGELTYVLRSDSSTTRPHTYSLASVNKFLSDIDEYIDEYNEKYPDSPMLYDYEPGVNWASLISNYLPIVLLFGSLIFFYMTMNQQGGGRIGQIGRARTNNGAEEGRTALFSDVAGAEEEKEELKEIVEYLKNPGRYNSLGAKIPKGVLLVGPPGTGKTLLARAVAGEAGVPFFSISGSDFVELYVGVGALRVRDLFEKAKKARPSIIFIDEIDAVGRQRGTGLGGGHDEREQTLNQLLVEMDGFAGNEGVIVMAATNRADILDSALLRPGRFDRTIYVGYPDVKGREEILKVHARNKPLGPDVDLGKIAKTTAGFTGADLENLLNEAALLAARKDRRAITEADIEEASIKVIAGPEKKSRVITEKSRKLTAYHEAGHAVAMFVATPEEPVHQISTVPRGQMGGFTQSLPTNEDYQTKESMCHSIITLLGGRVSEQIVLGDISTGASSDLQRATSIARSMVTKYGFSTRLGPVVYESHDEVFLGRDLGTRGYSEAVASEIDEEIRAIVEEAYDKCKNILTENRHKLDVVAEMLIKTEKMDGDTFKTIMESAEPEKLACVAQVLGENSETVKTEALPQQSDAADETKPKVEPADNAEQQNDAEQSNS